MGTLTKIEESIKVFDGLDPETIKKIHDAVKEAWLIGYETIKDDEYERGLKDGHKKGYVDGYNVGYKK